MYGVFELGPRPSRNTSEGYINWWSITALFKNSDDARLFVKALKSEGYAGTLSGPTKVRKIR